MSIVDKKFHDPPKEAVKMKRDRMLTISSLLSILLLSFHMTQDTLLEKRGTWPAGPINLIVIAILVVLLCGTLLLAGRRSGYIIMILGGLVATGMPVLHLRQGHFNPDRHPDPFFFMWVLIALGVIGLFSIILAARGFRDAGKPPT
jgi:hypothetical protein